jgi:hypothetical protein
MRAHTFDSRTWTPARDQPSLQLLPIHVVVTGFAALGVFAVWSSGLQDDAANRDAIAVACGLSVAGLIVYVRYVLGMPWISAPMVYLVLLWMFHYGLTFTAALVPDVLATVEEGGIDWLQSPNVGVAMILGVVGALGFVFGLGIVAARRQRLRAPSREPVPDLLLFNTGWLLLLGGLSVSALILVRGGGRAILAMGYMEFRTFVLAPTNLQSAVDVSQLGCVLAICGARRDQWIRPLAAWAPLACVMLLVGMRTEAMIPLVTFAIVLTHRGIKFRRAVLIGAVLAAVIIIPIVRTVRVVGFGNRSLVNWTEVSPLETLTELGGTLRAVKAYIDWIQQGDPYLLGASYWAPFDRHFLTRLVPGREPIPFQDDPRVPTRDMSDREGAVGASSTGEAYYNFGVVGPFLFYACVGMLFAWLERRAAATPHACAVFGIVMFLMFFNIRGEWLPVPLRAVFGVGVVASCYVVGRPRRAAA